MVVVVGGGGRAAGHLAHLMYVVQEHRGVDPTTGNKYVVPIELGRHLRFRNFSVRSFVRLGVKTSLNLKVYGSRMQTLID